MSYNPKVLIRRENRNGKYIVVARENGKIVSTNKWSPKSFKVTDAIKIYNRQKSVREDTERFLLGDKKQSIEVVKSGRRAKKQRSGKYSVFVERLLYDGNKIMVRSSQYSHDYPKNDAREEAYKNFYRRLAKEHGLPYDEDEGKVIENEVVKSIREGVVYYKGV